MEDVTAEYERAVGEQQALEAEITALVEELNSGPNAPGVRGALVDADGFPRGDIDVYRVRHVRHTLAMRQNDHKAVMRRIEELLPQCVAPPQQVPEKTELPIPEAVGDQDMEQKQAEGQEPIAVNAEDREKPAFAVVESVQPDSPAAWAGLQPRDEVLRFGSADASNHRELAAIREIVQHNLNHGIRVVVRRKQQPSQQHYEFQAMELTPQQWRGPGVLGCLLQPLRL
ncbi:hypothetical protein BBJ28_00013328 [Nothophytophthora sp. Chile5]|nr:hypothetical protein BBJ28_00013328 [Nothophytophthora sp. Chile5]